MTTLEQQEREIALLKTALRDAYQDLKRYKQVIDSLKTSLEVLETARKVDSKVIRRLREENWIWRRYLVG